jgi:hypothetical protein
MYLDYPLKHYRLYLIVVFMAIHIVEGVQLNKFEIRFEVASFAKDEAQRSNTVGSVSVDSPNTSFMQAHQGLETQRNATTLLSSPRLKALSSSLQSVLRRSVSWVSTAENTSPGASFMSPEGSFVSGGSASGSRSRLPSTNSMGSMGGQNNHYVLIGDDGNGRTSNYGMCHQNAH